MTIKNDETTFYHNVFNDNDKNSNERNLNDITKENKRQKLNMLNSTVLIETKIDMSFKILKIYHEIREDLKTL